jgi:flagellar protein FlaI
MNIPKPLIAMANVVMVMCRTEVDGRPSRRINTTAEVVKFDSEKDSIQTEEIFNWYPKFDRYSSLTKSGLLEKQMKRQGISEEEVRHEMSRRQVVLDWMARQGIRRCTDVANVIREYYANPERVYQKARVGLK